jgi:hypothetical protein
MLLWPFLIRTELRTAPKPGRELTGEARDSRPEWMRVATRYGLVPKLKPGPVTLDGSVDAAGRRLLHRTGDPDSLFTLGHMERGRVSVSAAIEVNDVKNRLIAPQQGTGDDRPRQVGDYQAVDTVVGGTPRQLRVGARVAF